MLKKGRNLACLLMAFIMVRLSGITALANAQEIMQELTEGSDSGPFAKLKGSFMEMGASAYGLMMAVGTLAVVFSLIWLFISFAFMGGNSAKADANKTRAKWVLVSGVGLFSIGGFMALLSSLGTEVNDTLVNPGMSLIPMFFNF